MQEEKLPNPKYYSSGWGRGGGGGADEARGGGEEILIPFKKWKSFKGIWELTSWI